MICDSLDFVVPMIPPSVNHYVRHTRDGRHYVTKEATAFKAAIPIAAKQQQVRKHFYTVLIDLTLGPRQRLDIDNCAKVVLDGLVEGGQIHSDAAIESLTLNKKRGNTASTRIVVW